MRLISYRLTDTAEDHLLLETNFLSPAEIKQELLPVMLADLGLGTMPPLSRELSSELGLEEGAVEFVRRRMLAAGTETWEPSQVLPALNVEKLDMDDAAVESLSAVLTRLSGSTGGTEQALEQVLARIAEAGGEDGTQFKETVRKIAELQNELEQQREVDDATLRTGDLESEVEGIDTTLQAVQHLAEREAELGKTLTTYEAQLGGNIAAETEQLKEKEREERTLSLVHPGAAASGAAAEQAEFAKVEKPRWLATFIPGLAGILLAVAVLAAAITQLVAVLIIGAVIAVFQMVIFFVINKIPSEVVVTPEPEPSKEEVAAAAVAAETAPPPPEERERKLFVAQAWMAALQSEVAELRQSMSRYLGGQDFEQIKSARLAVERELAGLKQKIDAFAGKEISPEDYLRKRRELDLLKVDRSRLESAMTESEDSELAGLIKEYNDLLDELEPDSGQGVDASFVKLVVPELDDIRSMDGKLQGLRAGEWKDLNLDLSQLAGVRILVAAAERERDESLPPVLAIGLRELLPENVRQGVDAKISSAGLPGRIVFLNPLP